MGRRGHASQGHEHLRKWEGTLEGRACCEESVEGEKQGSLEARPEGGPLSHACLLLAFSCPFHRGDSGRNTASHECNRGTKLCQIADLMLLLPWDVFFTYVTLPHLASTRCLHFCR